jgi:hypothetical protein
MRDSLAREASTPVAPPSVALSVSVAAGWGGAVVPGGWTGSDPDDRLGLFTAGDSVGDPPSVGGEEFTDDLTREIWVQSKNHPDTVRLERAAAKGPAPTIEMAHQKALHSPGMRAAGRALETLPASGLALPKKALTVRGLP